MKPLPFKWLMLSLLATLWPVWRWYVAGTLDGSNDGWGLLAAATAILLCLRARRESHAMQPAGGEMPPIKYASNSANDMYPAGGGMTAIKYSSNSANAMHPAVDGVTTTAQPGQNTLAPDGLASSAHPLALPANPLLLASLLLLAYLLATLAGLSPALRAIPGVLALAALASVGCFGRRLHLPLFALSLLALPLAASLQFYLGYPLRVLAGSVSVILLQLNGIAVLREGTLLNWGGQLISIDAPCSGVKMLWAAMYLTYTLAALHGLSVSKTMAAIALAVCTVVIANAVRAAALFYTESGIIHLPAWAHGVIGVIVFVAAASVIVSTIQRLNRPAQHVAGKYDGGASGVAEPQNTDIAEGAPTWFSA